MSARLVRLCVEVRDIRVCRCRDKSSAALCMTVAVSGRPVPLAAEMEANILNRRIQKKSRFAEEELQKGSSVSC